MLKNNQRIRTRILACFAAALLVSTADSQAAKVYKWVDESGKTHFGDRATDDSASVEEIRVPKTPAVDPSVNTRKERTERLLDNYKKERAEKNQRHEAAAAEKSERLAKCEAAKISQVKHERASLLYTEDEHGNRVYFSDEEREQAIADVNNAVLKWCS